MLVPSSEAVREASLFQGFPKTGDRAGDQGDDQEDDQEDDRLFDHPSSSQQWAPGQFLGKWL
jgi:hypothetical protein